MSFDAVFNEWAALRKKKKDLEEEIEKLKKLSLPLEQKLTFYMEEMDVTSVKRPEGTLIRTQKFSYRVPKGENLQAFFEHLKGRGLYDAYATVNSAQINSFANEEMSQALERGETNFEIPGLGKPSLTEYITLRKG